MLLKLAWRNLWRQKRRTLLTAGSIATTLLLMLVMRAIQVGTYEANIENSARFFTGLIQLQHPEYEDTNSIDDLLPGADSFIAAAQNIDGVSYTLPRIESFALAAAEERSKGVMVVGIEPELENDYSGIEERLISGTFIDSNDKENVVIGEGVADYFDLTLGDELILYGQGYRGQTAAGLYRIKGIVKFPVPQLDQQLVYLPLREAQQLYSTEEQVTAWLLHIDDIHHVDDTVRQLTETYSELNIVPEGVRVRGWRSLSPELSQQMAMDEVSNAFLMYLLYGIVGFGLFATLIMMTLERQREFAVMLATGMVRRKLLQLIATESVFIALLGVTVGVVAALPILGWFFFNPIELSGEYAEMMIEMGWEPILPVGLSLALFFEQINIVLGLVLICLLYPMWRVYHLDVVSGLKGGMHAN